MDPQTIIARRVAQELQAGDLVNLGIGIPTLVANYVPPELKVFFQSENGLIGTGPIPEQGMAHPLLTDAGGRPISALPGASTFDSAMSFGLIRGGHVDVTVLGGLQVDAHGHLANWMIPGKMVPGMGGAMDLVSGAKRVIVAMQHAAKGKSKIVAKCTLPLTSARPVHLVVTDMAVIAFPDGKATLLETAPGVSIGEVMAVTEAELVIPDTCPGNEDLTQVTDMRIFSDFDEIKSAVGTEIGVSDWIEVTQDRINKFAEATCDEQWIHVDQERARKELPGGTTIAHGLLSLALAPMFIRSVMGLKGLRNTLNYGADRITVPGAGAGRLETARPRHGRRSRGRAARWPARELSSRDRDRRRQDARPASPS